MDEWLEKKRRENKLNRELRREMRKAERTQTNTNCKVKVKLKCSIFWDIMPCSPLKVKTCLG
jgi:hypothetical protein